MTWWRLANLSMALWCTFTFLFLVVQFTDLRTLAFHAAWGYFSVAAFFLNRLP